MARRVHSRAWRALTRACVLSTIILATAAMTGCDDDGDGTTREVGSAALLSFDSKNLSAIAIPLVEPGEEPSLHVYLGGPDSPPFTLPNGRYAVAVVDALGNMDEQLHTVEDRASQVIFVQEPEPGDSPEDRDAQRNAAAILVDYALIQRLGMLQAEQALTTDFVFAIDDEANVITEEDYDFFVAVMNGLSEYEPQVVAAIERLFRDSPNAGQTIRAEAVGGRLLSPGAAPNYDVSDTINDIKDFGQKHGKGGKDKDARDTLLRNTENLSPEEQQEVFDDLKNGTRDNRNVKDAGGVAETNAADFFKALQQGKYDKIAQDLEKGARVNPGYSSELQKNKDTVNERGKRDGGAALKDGAKIVKGAIDVVIPDKAGKVVDAGEKINDLLDKQKPTEVPAQSTPIPRDKPPTKVPTTVPQQPTLVPTRVPTLVPTRVPTLVPTRVPTLVPTRVPTLVPTRVPTVAPTLVPTLVPTTVPTIAPTTVPTVNPTSPPSNPTAAPTAPPAVSSPAPTTVPATSPPGPVATEPSRSFLNEIMGLKVVLIKLGQGDAPNSTSYEIDVVVSTIVRTPPAAMVNCTTPFGTGHNIGSSALHPGQKFTIPLHREDLYPGSTVPVTCTITQGNTMSGSATVKGTCKASSTGALSLLAPDPCAPSPTVEPSPAAESPTAEPSVSATVAVTPTVEATAPATRPAATATVPPAATGVPPTATAMALPTNTFVPTLPPAPTDTIAPEPTEFVPEVIDGFFWPGDVFSVQTIPLPVGHTIQICLSGTMHLEEGDFGPAEMAFVNGIVPTPCATIIGDGGPAVIQCGHGTPLEDPGGFNVVVTDYGP